MLSGPLGIVLIVLLWLCVLTPLILRNQKPISRTNEGFDQTRVVLKGDEENGSPRRRRPRFFDLDEELALDEEATRVEGDLDPLIGDDEDYLLDAPSTVSAEGRATAAPHSRKKEVTHASSGVESTATTDDSATAVAEPEPAIEATAETVEEEATLPALGDTPLEQDTVAEAEPEEHIIEEDAAQDVLDAELLEDEALLEDAVEEVLSEEVLCEVVADSAEVVDSEVVDTEVLDSEVVAAAVEETTVSVEAEPIAESVDTESAVADSAPESTVVIDEAIMGPADVLHPGATYERLPQPEPEPEVVIDDSTELTAEDIAFAERRRGRGGYDPKADAAQRVTRYQRRVRTLMGLGIALILTLVLGFMYGGALWSPAVIAGALTVLYLWALRRNVKLEEELRRRRIQQMRRARLGVRSSQDEKLGIPDRLRRPGAVVVEAADESPDFDLLPLTHADFQTEEPDVVELDENLRVS
ncbi:MAG: hypothetical protein Q3972_02495 [Corynebacterium sp.]|nr:hypothetical protein [Corynebacterium sp.]